MGHSVVLLCELPAHSLSTQKISWVSSLYMCVIDIHHICTRIFFLKFSLYVRVPHFYDAANHFGFVIMPTRKHVPFLNLSWFLLAHISFTEQRVSF